MSLEIKRLELESLKVGAAKAEMEYAVLEKEEDIKRIKKEIENQDRRIAEIHNLIRNKETTK